jgi:hypothetical protein
MSQSRFKMLAKFGKVPNRAIENGRSSTVISGPVSTERIFLTLVQSGINLDSNALVPSFLFSQPGLRFRA